MLEFTVDPNKLSFIKIFIVVSLNFIRGIWGLYQIGIMKIYWELLKVRKVK